MAFLIFKNANLSQPDFYCHAESLALLPLDAFHKGRSPMQRWGYLLLFVTHSAYNRALTHKTTDSESAALM